MVNDVLIAHLRDEAVAEQIEKFVVGAVITRDDRYLLLERVPDDFMGGLVELPSGTVDPGENLLEALTREVQEETGLAIAAVPHYLGAFDYRSGSGKRTRQFNFLVETGNGDVVLNPGEHSSLYWVTGDEIAERKVSAATKVILEEAAKRVSQDFEKNAEQA